MRVMMALSLLVNGLDGCRGTVSYGYQHDILREVHIHVLNDH